MINENPNLTFLSEQYEAGKSGVILEGSSRSGKTWASLFFIVKLCIFVKPKTITIVKETYNSFKTTLHEDFKRILEGMNLDNPFERNKEIPSFKIFGTTIQFMGADTPSKFHGLGSDFVYFNEMLEIPQSIFDQAEQRCRSFWWGDYNPSVSLHYIYDSVIPRDDVAFLKTTFKDNPHISRQEKRKILSYEPTQDNIRQGTADDYMWAVYGLGERMSRSGLVFQHVNWIDSFPDNIERISYGQDFGYTTDPSATVKVGIEGNNMYIQLLVYEPTKNAEALSHLLNAVKVDGYIWCDSADPAMISDLRKLGHKAFGVKKFSGSIEYGIGMIKKYKVHIVRNRNAEREQQNYTWKTVNGIALDIPIDSFNHMWDAVRYACLGGLR